MLYLKVFSVRIIFNTHDIPTWRVTGLKGLTPRQLIVGFDKSISLRYSKTDNIKFWLNITNRLYVLFLLTFRWPSKCLAPKMYKIIFILCLAFFAVLAKHEIYEG